MNFVHLRTNTEFSIVQGSNRIDDLIGKAAEDSMAALAMTDLNGMFGAVTFYQEARSNGVKPIIGVDVSIEQEDGNTYQIILLAKNQNGYKSITELVSKGYTENRTSKGVSAKEEWLADLEDVVVLSGAKHGLIGKMLLADDFEGAKLVASQMKEFFGDDFYIELQRDGSPEEEKYMDGAVQICADLGLAPVATHPCLFTNQDDFLSHEARYCISNKKILFDIKRERPFNKEMYVKTQSEMTELFSDLPQALENTVTIAKKCNADLELDKPKLPIFDTPDNQPVDEYFANLARTGLEERLIDDYPNVIDRDEKRAEYEERLEREIGIIQRMGFPSYFLIVSDFITWAKNQDIPVGPGRGSGAGSLVAYAMKITDLDPLPYGLLFERFLNPDRVSMPDFDIDFCQERRDEVYEYVRQKYGTDSVAHIGTFGTMAAKAVIRDVGRVLNYPNGFNDSLAKMVNIKPGKKITLKQFIFGDDKEEIFGDGPLRERYDEEPDVKKLIDIALRIEGLTKNLGTHAAGVVIAPTTLTDFSPLYTAEAGGDVTTQFDGGDVEKSGLVKFDFLGLTTLTIIKEAVDLINEHKAQKGEEPLNLRKVPLDDAEVYEGIFAKGNTTSIFQFEGKGMTDVLKKAKPSRLEDLTAINALYRPGPMEIIPAWLTSKETPEQNRTYPHEKLKGVLQETYGFMIYQEQVMQCAQIIAGYSLGEADILRRAMGKKKVDVMREERQKFIDGAATHSNLSKENAESLFDLIDKFSGYGFNKSHAAAYSYLAYHTAYLKQHYPEEFLAANFNANFNSNANASVSSQLNVDKIAVLFNDAVHKNNMTINPPDINKSFVSFTVEGERTLRYGLGALKSVGNKAAHLIADDREKNGPYVDFYDFLERVGKGPVNKRAMESLVRSGAFDSMNPNRAQLFDGIAEGLDYVAKYRKKQLSEVSVMGSSLFDDDEEVVPVKKKSTRAKKPVEAIRPELKDIQPWDELSVLKNEKSSFGYFFSSNPYISYYSKQLGGFPTATPLSQVEAEFENGEREFFVGGLVEEIKWFASKKGAFVTITDGVGTQELMMYADFLNENKNWFKVDNFAAIRLKGEVKFDDEGNESTSFKMIQAFNYDQVIKLTANKVFVGSEDKPELIEKFESLCNEYIGAPEDKDSTAVLCLPSVQDPNRRTRKAKTYFVKADVKLIEELSNTFGEEWVKLSFKENLDNVVFPELAYKKKGNNNGKKFVKKNSFSS